MKMKFGILSVVLVSALLASASQRLIPALTPPVHEDAETTTNVVLSARGPEMRVFEFALSCLVTPTNNVEIALGKDTDGDGSLSHFEMALIVGWDCGKWFVRRRADGISVESPDSGSSDMKTLSWKLRLSSSAVPVSLSAFSDGCPVL